jgi:sarcosine oxidase subunit gamma
VIAEATRRSPLADYSDRFASLSRSSNGSLEIREIPFLTQVNLRADPADASSMQAVRHELGFDLPVLPNTVASAGDRSALWLGPDEWLIVASPGHGAAIEGSTRKALAASRSVVDVSANRTAISVQGTAARELLAFGCAIDLDARAFGPGRCAQTMLAKAQVIIQHLAAGPAFIVYVRASFATYLADWLLDASDAL